MLIALDQDDLRITYMTGTCATAVIAFTGIGHALGAIQTEEFKSSISKSAAHGNRPSTVYVVDRHRRWFNHGLTARIQDIVGSILVTVEANRAVTLGNSMGGFGALVFAGRISNCIRAIAFCPQSSVRRDIVRCENRWNDYVSKITQWELEDAIEEVGSEIDYHLFYGTGDQLDLMHARRFSELELPNVAVHLISQCGHDVAATLKARGMLQPLLDKLIWEDHLSLRGGCLV